MTEILTESFCERCGTRYTFESSAPRRSRLGRVRTLSKGVRNFVLSDESSFSEAMADARGEEELSATVHQLDAFHKTFNFCLTCRQYTCGNCWNGAQGRCLTCAPAPDQEEAIAAAAILDLTPGMVDGNGQAPSDMAEAWPEADLSSERLSRVLGEPEPVEEIVVASLAADALPEPEPVMAVEPEPVAVEPEPEPEPVEEIVVASLAADALPEPEPVMAVEPEPVAVEPEPEPEPVEEIAASPGLGAAAVAADTLADEPLEDDDLDIVAPAALALAAAAAIAGEPEIPSVRGVERGQTLEEAVAAYEARLAVEDARSIEPVAAADGEVPVVEPEPVAAAPEPEPVAAAPEPEPVAAAPEPEPRDDLIAQPTWPVATPDAPLPAEAPFAPPAPPPLATPDRPAPGAMPWLSVAPDEGVAPAEPQWPTPPVWPVLTTRRDVPTTLVGRPLLPQAETSALWAASAREVLGVPAPGTPTPGPAPAAPTPQPCVQCGLSLSANARFCRRCGTRQG